jgi:hypothetical protein
MKLDRASIQKLELVLVVITLAVLAIGYVVSKW